MLSIDMLHKIRRDEITRLAEPLTPGMRVLEIGAGTGFQARALAERGFQVSAIDLPGSDYAAVRIFPVTDYDGKLIPFPDGSFDAVLSSNVLEHVHDLDGLQAEIRRVLAPGGECVHAMPSASWRAWTSISGFVDLVPFFIRQLTWLFTGKRPVSFETTRRPWPIAFIRGVGARILPLAHGETGNALTELWSFSRFAWRRRFRAQKFEILEVRPMELFYTGQMVLGPLWPIAGRHRAARWLGSACILYRVRPARP